MQHQIILRFLYAPPSGLFNLARCILQTAFCCRVFPVSWTPSRFFPYVEIFHMSTFLSHVVGFQMSKIFHKSKILLLFFQRSNFFHVENLSQVEKFLSVEFFHAVQFCDMSKISSKSKNFLMTMKFHMSSTSPSVGRVEECLKPNFAPKLNP